MNKYYLIIELERKKIKLLTKHINYRQELKKNLEKSSKRYASVCSCY